MAQFHRDLRADIESKVPAGGPVRAVVLLHSITGTSAGPDGTGPTLSANWEDDYVRKHDLDTDRRIDGIYGTFGLVTVLTDTQLHFFYSAGPMRKGGPVVLLSSHPLGEVVLRHQRSGLPGLRSRMMHFTFPDGWFFVGSAPAMRWARNVLNEPDAFLEAYGPDAIDNRA